MTSHSFFSFYLFSFVHLFLTYYFILVYHSDSIQLLFFVAMTLFLFLFALLSFSVSIFYSDPPKKNLIFPVLSFLSVSLHFSDLLLLPFSFSCITFFSVSVYYFDSSHVPVFVPLFLRLLVVFSYLLITVMFTIQTHSTFPFLLS